MSPKRRRRNSNKLPAAALGGSSTIMIIFVACIVALLIIPAMLASMRVVPPLVASRRNHAEEDLSTATTTMTSNHQVRQRQQPQQKDDQHDGEQHKQKQEVDKENQHQQQQQSISSLNHTNVVDPQYTPSWIADCPKAMTMMTNQHNIRVLDDATDLVVSEFVPSLIATASASAGVVAAPRPVKISTHTSMEDEGVSLQIRQSGCFESHVARPLIWTTINTLMMQQQQRRSQSTKEEVGPLVVDENANANDLIFIDMGGNIGQYSLFMASLGISTYTFEPFLKNYRRICHSIRSNPGFDRLVNLFNVALGTHEHDVMFDLSWARRKNFGGISTVDAPAGSGSSSSSDSTTTHGQLNHLGVAGLDYAHAITFDQIKDVLPRGEEKKVSVILKVDVEGNECAALGGAMKYLSSSFVDIKYVAIEWSQKRLRTGCPNQAEIFDLFAVKNKLTPYQFVTATGQWQQLDPTQWKQWRFPGKKGQAAFKFLYDVAWSRTNMTELL